MSAKLLQRPKGCFACIISCGRVTKVTNPKYAGEGEGPEYETAWGFGGDCGVGGVGWGVRGELKFACKLKLAPRGIYFVA